jgi:hypothetical protein
LLLLLQRLA